MPVGCGSHTARIIDRDGAVVANADVLLSVEWARVLDDISTAKILVQPDGDCCAQLARVRSWRHKLAIYRDGQPCWEGPILTPEWNADGTVEIQAADILAWLDRRVPHASIRFTGEELAKIALWLIEDGFAPDDPGHSVEVIAPTRIRGDREYEKDVGQTGDHLRDLAETGLDYTAVGSKILLMPEEHCGRVGSLTDADFPDGLVIVEDGLALATRWVIHGKDDVKGEAGGTHPYYGLLERSVEETSVLDEASATLAARSRWRASSPAPVFIDSQQTTLSPEAAIDIPSLVPGWCVDVTTTATCRNISQSLKIVGMKVVEDADGERVTVQLTPAGA
ncbi:hypothetical protein [Streptomyces sp. NBC_01727]|uniref:hypothetical protein n=1 Tax=Streptomyces sp. NBC_01727 TaxID=2975924 RepID=UPI002E117C09|nr:hypothetical protein OIE76_06805 [Streptomyces sp. NBC_01727]